MIKKLFYELKHNKWFLGFFISSLIIILLDLAVVIFDIVEILTTPANSASLANSFVFFNVMAISLSVINVVAIIIYLCVRKK